MRRKARWPGLALAIGLFSTQAGAGEPPFLAVSDTGATAPPHANGAVGPNRLVAMHKSQIIVRDFGGTQVEPATDLGVFWTGYRLGSAVPPRAPRVVYDPVAARWIVASWDKADSGGNAVLMVGVSLSGNPSLQTPLSTYWYRKAIDLDPADLLVGDEYLSIGFSADRVVVQINLYQGTTFVGARLYVFPKASMSAPPDLDSYAVIQRPDTDGKSLVPAATYYETATPINDVYVVQSWAPGAGKLRLLKVTGSAASPSLASVGEPQGPTPWSHTAPAIPAVSDPENFLPQKQAGGDGCADCPTPGDCRIYAGDSRIQNVVYRSGSVWATHTVFLPSPDRAAVQWWKIDPLSPGLPQQGLIDDPDDSAPEGLWHFAYPSIAVNANDDVLIGYSRFNLGAYAGTAYSLRTGGEPGAWAQAGIKGGEACYYKTYGGLRNFWGPYSSTVVDPDEVRMWTLQEHAAPPAPTGLFKDRWATVWGPPTPEISIADAYLAEEGDSGTTTIEFDVTLSVPTAEPVSVLWATADDSAKVADGDYDSGSGTLTFDPGVTTRKIQVVVNGDTKTEALERFFVDLSSPVNATFADQHAVGTIDNDDPVPLIAINDVQAPEGSPSGTTLFQFAVTLTNPSASSVSVHWKVAYELPAGPGNADASDLAISEGDVVFAPGDTEEPVFVPVNKDATPGEGSERFRVDLSAPTGGAGLLRAAGYGVILDDDQANPPVIGLAIVSDNARNRLQWTNPLWSATPNRVLVRYASGPSCVAPSTVTGGTGEFSLTPGAMGLPQLRPDPNALVNDTEYCYTLFLDYGTVPGGPYSTGVSAKGTPFSDSRIKWKYATATSATSLAAPALHAFGSGGVLAPSNDGYVHGMARGPAGGTWPTNWASANLGSPAQARSPIVTLGGVPRMYLTTFDGWVHAIDARTGARIWDTRIGTDLFTGGGAAPAGIFTAFGGSWDYLLVGTRQGSGNRFYALDPFTGAVIDFYPQAGDPVQELGAVTGMATVDYELGQVYFATFSSGGSQYHTLWCLKLGPRSDALQFGWARQKDDDVPSSGVDGIGNVDSSPSLRGERLYVMNTDGMLWAINRRSGNSLDVFLTGTGNIRGFPFLDRSSGDIYLTKASGGLNVWAVKDSGTDSTPTSALSEKWKTFAVNPSTALLITAPGIAGLYLGTDEVLGPGLPGILAVDLGTGGSGTGYILDNGIHTIGAPSFDSQYKMIHVGSSKGVFYALDLSF